MSAGAHMPVRVRVVKQMRTPEKIAEKNSDPGRHRQCCGWLGCDCSREGTRTKCDHACAQSEGSPKSHVLHHVQSCIAPDQVTVGIIVVRVEAPRTRVRKPWNRLRASLRSSRLEAGSVSSASLPPRSSWWIRISSPTRRSIHTCSGIPFGSRGPFAGTTSRSRLRSDKRMRPPCALAPPDRQNARVTGILRTVVTKKKGERPTQNETWTDKGNSTHAPPRTLTVDCPLGCPHPMLPCADQPSFLQYQVCAGIGCVDMGLSLAHCWFLSFLSGDEHLVVQCGRENTCPTPLVESVMCIQESTGSTDIMQNAPEGGVHRSFIRIILYGGLAQILGQDQARRFYSVTCLSCSSARLKPSRSHGTQCEHTLCKKNAIRYRNTHKTLA